VREPGDYAAILGDPAALADLRSRYTGSGDPADVLRWRDDPDAPGGDGSRSPTARARDLAPALYRRAGTPEAERERDAAAAETEVLLAQWTADNAALDAALIVEAPSQPGRREHRARRTPVRPGRIGLLVGAGVVALAVLVGLGVLLRPSIPAVTVSEPTASTPTPTPAATSSAPSSTPTIAPAPPPVQVTPPPEPEDTDFRREYFEDDIMSVLQVPLNGPPIDNANGAATIDDYGVPLSYVVAEGDVFELIAKRFDLGTSYLASINAVRRENPTELFVGDTINLGATTILRIGDQNGVVYNHTDRLPEPHLPQD